MNPLGYASSSASAGRLPMVSTVHKPRRRPGSPTLAQHPRSTTPLRQDLLNDLWSSKHPRATWYLLRCWRRQGSVPGPVYAAISADPQAAKAWLAALSWKQALGLVRNAPWWQIHGRVGDLLLKHCVGATLEAAAQLSAPAWQRLLAMWETCLNPRAEDRPKGRNADWDVDHEPRRADASLAWTCVAQLLDAMDTSAQMHERLQPVLCTFMTRVRGLLRGHLRRVGIQPPTAMGPQLTHSDKGFTIHIGPGSSLQFHWLGYAWQVSDGDGLQRDFMLGGCLPERADFPDRLQRQWIASASYIPEQVLCAAYRLPSTLAHSLVDEGKGLGAQARTGDLCNHGSWWSDTLAPIIRRALTEAEQRQADPQVIAIHQRMHAIQALSAPLDHLGPLANPAFWQHPYLTQDILRYDYAAILLRELITIEVRDEARESTLLARGWEAVCSFPIAPSRSLRRTLANIRISTWPMVRHCQLMNLGCLPLPRPLHGTSLLIGLALASLASRGEVHAMTTIALHTDESRLRRDLNEWHQWRMIGNRHSPSRQLCSILDCFHCPEARSTVKRFVYHSIYWHQNVWRQPTQPFDPATPLAPLPIPLPSPLNNGHTHLKALTTAGALIAEGNTMQHCIGSPKHIQAGCDGHSYFIHVQHGTHHASVELDQSLQVVQAKGPNNTRNLACLWSEDHLCNYLQTSVT